MLSYAYLQASYQSLQIVLYRMHKCCYIKHITYSCIRRTSLIAVGNPCVKYKQFRS